MEEYIKECKKDVIKNLSVNFCLTGLATIIGYAIIFVVSQFVSWIDVPIDTFIGLFVGMFAIDVSKDCRQYYRYCQAHIEYKKQEEERLEKEASIRAEYENSKKEVK